MTEPTTAPATTPPQPEPSTTAPAQAPDTDWKAEARKWEARAKENTQKVQELQPLADQFRQLDEASKSEMQRLQESLDAAARERDTTSGEALRLRTAMQHGLSLEDIDLLGTGTEDELTARATRIADLRRAAATPPVTAPPAPHTVPALRPGATPPAAPDNDSIEARHQRYFAGRQTPQ